MNTDNAGAGWSPGCELRAAGRARAAEEHGAAGERGVLAQPPPCQLLPGLPGMRASAAGDEEGRTRLQEGKKEAAMVEVLLCQAEQEKAPGAISGSSPAPAARTLKSLLHPFQGFRVFLPVEKCP